MDTFDSLVESVFNQSYQNWEWIISDDFSENPDVLIKLNGLLQLSHKIKLVQPKFKKEFYWNPPTSESTGDIFLVQDSDDLMHPKLLEVYKHNFDKFPEVQLISTNSILKWNDINGPTHSFRLINYKNRCNFIDKISNAVSGEYNIGDCRAWRNNIDLFDPEKKWQFCAEDVCKTLINEEVGKLLYLPRTLHTYAHREQSISKVPTSNENFLNEHLIMIEESRKRKNRKYYNSIEDYYDKIFDFTTPFYLSKLNLEKESCRVEFYSTKINPRACESLKELYFDHDLYFETDNQVDYLIMQMTDSVNSEYLYKKIQNKPRKQIIIETAPEYQDLISTLLLGNSMQHYWFSFGKLYFIIDC
jgi:glycosyltransferase involved in cell wall biosynthesis